MVLICAGDTSGRLNGQQLLWTVAHVAVRRRCPMVASIAAQMSTSGRSRGEIRARMVAQAVQVVVMVVMMRMLQCMMRLWLYLIRVLVMSTNFTRHNHIIGQVMGTVRTVPTTGSLNGCP